MRAVNEAVDRRHTSVPAGRIVRVLRPAAAVAALLALLWAAPAAAQEPREAAEEEPEADPFAGPTIFEAGSDRAVSASRLRLGTDDAPPLVSESDHYRASFLIDRAGPDPVGATARVLRSNPLGLEIPPTVRTNDRVVLALGGLDAAEGDVLQAVRHGRTLPGGHRVLHSVALVELTRVAGDSARGVVRSVFSDYQVGDPVIAAEPFRAGALRRLAPADGRLVARVTGLETPQELVGTNDRVFLDAGSEAGLGPGDELLVFPEDTPDPAGADPADRLGVLRVVRAQPETATARVVETRDVGLRADCPAVLVRRAISGER